MAGNRRKEIDKAIQHLNHYIEASEKWRPLLNELMVQFFSPVADHYDQDLDHVMDRLFEGSAGSLALSFIYESMATTYWDNAKQSPLEEFMVKRGWREGTYGKRYLRLMQQSEIQLLQVTALEAGTWIELKAWGTDTTLRVAHAASAFEFHEYLIARPLTEGKNRRLSDATLKLTPLAASNVLKALDAVPGELAGYFQEAVAEGEADGLTIDFADDIPEFQYNTLIETGFKEWAIGILDAADSDLRK